MYMPINIYIHIYTHIYIHTYACRHVYTFTHTHIYIYIYIYTGMYMHIYIYIHTYTYTYLVSYEKCSSELCLLQSNSAQTKSCNLATKLFYLQMMLQANTLTNCTPWLRARWSVLAHVVFAIIRHFASL